MSTLPTAGHKRMHQLHHTRSAAELEERLIHLGVDLDSALRRHGIDPARHGVLVTGSISEGIGTSTSDLDLLALVEDALDEHAAPAITIRMRLSSEFLLYDHGVELNIETLRRPQLAHSLRGFLEVAPALYDPRGLTVLPIIGPDERRLLHRLLNGWALRRPDIVERWRDEFLVALFPPYVALLALVSYNEAVEHACAVRDADDGSFPAEACTTVGLRRCRACWRCTV